MNQITKNELQYILEDCLLLGPDEFTLEMNFSELESWDSLARTVLATILSEKLDLQITAGDLNEIDCVPQLSDFLNSKGMEL